MDTAMRRSSRQKRRPGWLRLFIRCFLLIGILIMGGLLIAISCAFLLKAPPIQVDQSTIFMGQTTLL